MTFTFVSLSSSANQSNICLYLSVNFEERFLSLSQTLNFLRVLPLSVGVHKVVGWFSALGIIRNLGVAGSNQ